MVFEMYKIEKFKVGTAGNYTYIISDSVSKIAVSIDPAWELNKIEECLQESNTSLKAILLRQHLII